MSGVLALSAVALAMRSGITLLLGIGGVMVALVMIPGNFFSKNRKTPQRQASRPKAQRIALKVAKNVVGTAFLVLGIVMTLPLVPGPGIVVLLLGVTLVDVPGKRRFQRYLISRPMVLKPVNKLRALCHRPKLRTS